MVHRMRGKPKPEGNNVYSQLCSCGKKIKGTSASAAIIAWNKHRKQHDGKDK
jgi:hypothetical protein